MDLNLGSSLPLNGVTTLLLPVLGISSFFEREERQQKMERKIRVGLGGQMTTCKTKQK